MDCSTVERFMLEFVEGTLPERVAVQIKSHVEACGTCMSKLEDQSSRTHVLESLGRVKGPDQWEDISRSMRKAWPRFLFKRYGFQAVVFIIAAVIAIIVCAYAIPALREKPAEGPSPPTGETESILSPQSEAP